MEPVIAWILSFIVSVAPPGRPAFYPEAQETKQEAMERYNDIATDIIEVVYDPNTKPLFGGRWGRARTVTVLLGIMLYESGFWRNVDFGVGKYGRGDKGNSWCLMQMNVGNGRPWTRGGGYNVKHDRPWRFGDKAEDLIEGASGPEMVADRRKCITEGLRLIRLSFRSCRSNPLKERLNVYASGNCKYGSAGSRIRMAAAIKFFEESAELRKKFKDQEVVTAVEEMMREREAEAAKAKKVAKSKPADPKNPKKPPPSQKIAVVTRRDE